MAPLIMVIEDELAILDLYQELLTDAGYDVALYADPQHAVADIAWVKPDLVILDWIFSAGEPGRGTVQQLRLHPALHGRKLLVCTGAIHHVPQFETELDAAGVPVVYKPFHNDDLLRAVRQLLGAGDAASFTNTA